LSRSPKTWRTAESRCEIAVNDWIDEIAKLWEIADGRGGTVTSFRVYEKNEFPESLPAGVICAITYTLDVESAYSLGGPLVDRWRGITEFHFPWGVDKSHFPEIMLFFARIRNAAAGSMTLGSRVAHFLLRTQNTGGQSIQGPVTLTYGSEAPHHGLLVYWEVKDDESGQFTPAA